MKKIAFLLVLLAFPVFLWAQERNVTLQIKEMKVEQAVLKLRKTSGFKFLFNHEEVKNAGSKTIDMKNRPLPEVMDALLKNTNLTYRIEKDIVVIIPQKSTPTKVQKVKVNGIVTDKDRNALPGVAIINSSTGWGTTTDIDGNFMLEVPNDTHTILCFSMLGMKSQEMMLGNRRTFNIVMEENSVQLNDVVVTGYQTISKERSAGSFSVISGSEISDKTGLTGNIIESLEGLTTGLSVNFSEGQDKFLIRGITSINSTRSPLYVVDGVPMSADTFEKMINSNDIEKVTFLKDATAASIWGAQAANGVMVVTTKEGTNTDKKVRISYNGSYTYKGKPDYDYMQYMSSDMFIKSAQEIFNPDFYTWQSVTTTTNGISGKIPIVYPHEMIMYKQLNGEISATDADRALQQLASQNNRNQIEDNFMKGAFFTKHSLSFQGGGEKYNFYGSFGYEHSTASNRDKSNNYQLNLKQNFDLTKWLSMDLGINLALSDNNYAISPYQTDLNTVFPYMMFTDANGNPISHSDLLYYEPNRLDYEQKSGKSLDYTPLTDNREGFNKSLGYDARVNLGIHVKILKGLSYDGRFQYQRGNDKKEVFSEQNSYRVREELVRLATVDKTTGSPVFYLPTTGGNYQTTNNNTTNWTVRNQLMFDRTFDKIESQITALAGMEVRSDKVNIQNTNLRGYNPQTMTYTSYDELTLQTTGVKNPIIPSTGSAATLSSKSNSFSETELRFVSAYANAAYTWKSKYSVNASIRVDQSNLFGSDPSVQFKPIWAVGGAWSLGQEEFMKQADFLNRLNLRFSYGLGGNSPDPGLGGPYDILYPVNNSLFSSLGQGYVVITPANDKLTWEKTSIINCGVDFAMFNHRLSGSVDVYLKNTTNLLGNIALHPSSGWGKALANFGSMKNSGFELSLNSHNIKGREFNWLTNFTLTFNKNKVTELYVEDGKSPSSLIKKNFVAGYAAQSLFAYQWAGLDDMGDPQVYDENGNKVKLSKNLTDINALRCMGSMQPLWYGGLTNTFSYKGFDLSFMFIYNLGHKMRNDTNSFWSGRLTGNIHKDFNDRWRQKGDENFTNVPSYVSNTKESTTRREYEFYQYADINILNASYIKLRDLSLSYSLPQNICAKFASENIKIRLQAANLFYIAANKEGIDPEAQNLRYGRRTTHYGPSYSVGVTINFK